MVLITLKGEGFKIGSRNYALFVKSGLDVSSQYKVGKLKNGDLVRLEGIIADLKLETWGPSTNRRNHISLLMYSVLSVTDKPPAVIKKPPQKKKRIVSPEEKAMGKVQLARNYISSGLKEKARSILESVIADYPDTAAAGEAKRELEKLRKPNSVKNPN